METNKTRAEHIEAWDIQRLGIDREKNPKRIEWKSIEKNLFVFCGRSQRLIKIIYWVWSLRLRRRRHARREAGEVNI